MKRARSTAYPVLDLAAAYRILRQDLEGLGAAELDRDEIAKRIGYNDALGGLAARKVGALVHYGLFVRRGSRYGLSPLGLRLQNLDIRDAEFPSAIRTALEHPLLFKAILDRHRAGGRIPRSLAADLAAFGITEKASADAEDVFRSSALFAGVLDTEGIFSPAPMAKSAALPPPETHYDLGASKARDSEEIEISLLLSKGRKGKLILPQPFGAQDYLALKEAFLAQYKLLKRHLEIEIPATRKNDARAKTKPQDSSLPLRFHGGKKRLR